MALNWFKKKQKDEASAEESTEVAETEAAESESAEAVEADSDSHTDSPEEDESVGESGQSGIVEASETAPEGEPGEGEAEHKKGFFKGAWEATKKLALTPVDPFFENMVAGLERTRKSLLGQISSVFRLHKKVNEDFWEELEDTLITSDVGTSATDAFDCAT